MCYVRAAGADITMAEFGTGSDSDHTTASQSVVVLAGTDHTAPGGRCGCLRECVRGGGGEGYGAYELRSVRGRDQWPLDEAMFCHVTLCRGRRRIEHRCAECAQPVHGPHLGVEVGHLRGDGHQAVIRRSSGGHQAGIRRASGGRQAGIGRSSGGRHAMVGRSSGDHPTVIRRLSAHLCDGYIGAACELAELSEAGLLALGELRDVPLSRVAGD